MFATLLTALFGVSVDCPDVLNLAKGLYMDLIQSSIWTKLQVDCCSGDQNTSPYVTCTNQRVTQIVWTGLGLNGTINETALSTGLNSLNLGNNGINGSIPSTLPSGIQYFDLRLNQITGGLAWNLPNATMVGDEP